MLNRKYLKFIFALAFISSSTERGLAFADYINDINDKTFVFDDKILENISRQVLDLNVKVEKCNEKLAKFDEAVEQITELNSKLERYNARVAEIIESKASNSSLNADAFRQMTAHPLCMKPNSLPSSCAEALQAKGYTSSKHSGVFQLHIPESGLKPFYVYCLRDETEKGRPWTIIQRRQYDAIVFDRQWHAYENGFGNLEHSHFLGLKYINAITAMQMHELWIELKDFENNVRSAYYETFAIGDESTQYTLNVLGKFHGDAGDSFSRHQGQHFSTSDSDNDESDTNCAQRYRSGWWHEQCIDSNLNGWYYKGTYSNATANGIVWKTWHGYWYSLSYTHMAIRPVK